MEGVSRVQDHEDRLESTEVLPELGLNLAATAGRVPETDVEVGHPLDPLRRTQPPESPLELRVGAFVAVKRTGPDSSTSK